MPPLSNWIHALENSELAEGIRRSIWLYPVIEIVHIFGFVLLVGTAIMFDLRLLGLSKSIPVRNLANHLLPWSRGGLLLIIPSGVLLFSTNAVSLASDPVFAIKLSLIILAGINAVIFHKTIFTSVATWDKDCKSPMNARFNAIISIFLWLTVISCGRLLAY